MRTLVEKSHPPVNHVRLSTADVSCFAYDSHQLIMRSPYLINTRSRKFIYCHTAAPWPFDTQPPDLIAT